MKFSPQMWSLRSGYLSFDNTVIASYEYFSLLYLLVRTAIGQFSGPYSSVRLAKSKILFVRALFQDKEI